MRALYYASAMKSKPIMSSSSLPPSSLLLLAAGRGMGAGAGAAGGALGANGCTGAYGGAPGRMSPWVRERQHACVSYQEGCKRG